MSKAKYPRFSKKAEVKTVTLRDFLDNWVDQIAHHEWENRLQRKFELRKTEGDMLMPRALAMNALAGCLIQPITLWGNPPADVAKNKKFLSIDGKTRTGAFAMFETGTAYDNVVTDLSKMTFPKGFICEGVDLTGMTLQQIRAEHPSIAKRWDNIPLQINIMYFAETTDAVNYFDVANGTAKPLSPGEKFHAITGPRSDFAFTTVTQSWAPFFNAWKAGKNGDTNYERQQELWTGQILKLYEDTADDPARNTAEMLKYAAREDPIPSDAIVGVTNMLRNMQDMQGHCRLHMSKSKASVYAGFLRELERQDKDIYNNPEWWTFIHKFITSIVTKNEGDLERLISRFGENHPFVKASLGKEFLAGKKIALGMIQEGMLERKDVEKHRPGLYLEQRGRCAATGIRFEHMLSGHIDHIVPIAQGGSNDLSNLRLVTPRMNLQDGNKIES